MTAETIASALGGHRAGTTWMARCPVHEDRSPSLSITTGKDGKVLVRCHAGCDQRDLIAALLQRGLWQTNGRVSGIAFNHRRRLAEEPDADTLKRRAAALAIWQASQEAQGSPVGTYLRSRGLDLPVSSGPALPCRPETSLGRRLARDGGARDARRHRIADRRSSHLSRP
jgi:putative DNA primase/helicase